MRFLRYVFVILLLLSYWRSSASAPIQLTDGQESYGIGRSIEILKDAESSLTIEDILNSNAFEVSQQDVPNLQISNSTFWVKFSVQNNSSQENFLLSLAYPIIDEVQLFIPIENSEFVVEHSGESVPIKERKYQHQSFIFDLSIPHRESRTYFMRVKSGEQIMLPLTIGTPKAVFQAKTSTDLFNGIYFGMVLVMLLYNLFVYFSVRDKSYLLYVAYILFVGLTQASDGGYTYRMFWPQSPALANFMVTLFPSLVGTGAIFFMRFFLRTPKFIPKADRVFFVLTGVYALCVALFAVGFHQVGYQLTQVNALTVSVFMLAMAYRIMRKGYRPAKFFLAAWSVFLLSVCLFVMKDLGVLPYNSFTKHILHFGSAIELILLSFALADRINILKKEKEDSQARTLEALQENERIMREQNIILEAKVKERTHELQKSNSDLSVAIHDLKEAQSQLVDAEKMASLGQLTAGIAHEINNPINFVVSNINPLKRDINDMLAVLDKYAEITETTDVKGKLQEVSELKEQLDLSYVIEEINLLLKGIDDGANRTAEIVKSLRTFSRLDETDLKKADINDGIDSTLVLLNSSSASGVEVVKQYEVHDPIECYAGKLNQLFMNILKNAMQAVGEKQYTGQEKPTITIVTKELQEDILVSIKDNGIGMDEATQAKIFEPFFTTKDVGEGTGLGLSIVYSIIEKHNGLIEVESQPGIGTEFMIYVPKHQYKTDDKEKLKAHKAERRNRLLKQHKLINN